jgi:hypothetical protein
MGETMSMITEIAAYLATNLSKTVGIDIFINDIPEYPDDCLILFQYGGQESEFTHDGLRDVRPQLQVLTRSSQSDFATGEALALSVDSLLDGITNTTIGTTVYKSIRSLGQPAFYGPDAMGRPIWEENFSIVKGG